MTAVVVVYDAAAGIVWSGLIKCTESCLLINHTLHLPRTVDFGKWPRTSSREERRRKRRGKAANQDSLPG